MFGLKRSQGRLPVLLLLVAVLTLGAVGAAVASGTLNANNYLLSMGPTFQMTGDRVHENVSYTFTLINGNSSNVLVRGVGRSVPGLELLVPTGSGMKQKLIPLTGPGKTQIVPPHGAIRLTVWYHISDCAKVPKRSWPLTLSAAWGSERWQSVSISVPSGAVPWPRSVTEFICS